MRSEIRSMGKMSGLIFTASFLGWMVPKEVWAKPIAPKIHQRMLDFLTTYANSVPDGELLVDCCKQALI